MQPWPPITESGEKRECTNCGAHVSAVFRRAFSDDSGRVHACPSCTTYRELEETAGGRA